MLSQQVKTLSKPVFTSGAEETIATTSLTAAWSGISVYVFNLLLAGCVCKSQPPWVTRRWNSSTFQHETTWFRCSCGLQRFAAQAFSDGWEDRGACLSVTKPRRSVVQSAWTRPRPQTTEHEHRTWEIFSRWLITSCTACLRRWWHVSLTDYDASKWPQIQISTSRPPHVEQAGEWCRSSDIISLVTGHQILQRRSQKGFLYYSAKAPKHQEHLDSDPQRCQTGAELTEQSSFKGLHACNSFNRPLEGRHEQQLWLWCLNDRLLW